jgi:hypothetical protein
MEQIEVISWKTLDALKQAATHIEEILGDLDTNEQMAVFCSIEEDYLELYYTELEGNYIRHFDDEEEMLKFLTERRTELGEHEYDVDYFEEETDYGEKNEEDYTGYRIKDEGEEDEF